MKDKHLNSMENQLVCSYHFAEQKLEDRLSDVNDARMCCFTFSNHCKFGLAFAVVEFIFLVQILNCIVNCSPLGPVTLQQLEFSIVSHEARFVFFQYFYCVTTVAWMAESWCQQSKEDHSATNITLGK